MSHMEGPFENEIAIELGGRTDIVNVRLGELRDCVLKEFNLPPVKEVKWEHIRSKFFQDIK